MVTRACNFSTQEAGAGGSPQVQDQAGLQGKSDVQLEDIVRLAQTNQRGQQGEAAQGDHRASPCRSSIVHWHFICHKWHFTYCLSSHAYNKMGEWHFLRESQKGRQPLLTNSGNITKASSKLSKQGLTHFNPSTRKAETGGSP